MSKVIDITDKLSFNENPILKVKNQQLEVQADAETMLRIMGLFNEKSETVAAVEAASLLFSEADKRKIAKMKLSMKDYMVLIETAMNVAMGENEEGEQ